MLLTARENVVFVAIYCLSGGDGYSGGHCSREALPVCCDAQLLLQVGFWGEKAKRVLKSPEVKSKASGSSPTGTNCTAVMYPEVPHSLIHSPACLVLRVNTVYWTLWLGWLGWLLEHLGALVGSYEYFCTRPPVWEDGRRKSSTVRRVHEWNKDIAIISIHCWYPVLKWRRHGLQVVYLSWRSTQTLFFSSRKEQIGLQWCDLTDHQNLYWWPWGIQGPWYHFQSANSNDPTTYIHTCLQHIATR